MKELIISQSITLRNYQSLDRYFNEINKIPLITSDEEIELARKIREGDKASFERLVSSNLRFVVSVAKQYQNQGLSIGDLINEGNIGLMNAAKKFDESRGFKFISFAVWWIRQSIIFAIEEQTRIVHLPYNQVTLLGKYNKVYAKLEQQYGRQPTEHELAADLGLTVDKLRDLVRHTGKHISLDRPVAENSEMTMLDTIKSDNLFSENAITSVNVRNYILRCLNVLKDKERQIVTQYFGLTSLEPMPLEEIAKRINRSVEQTRRLKDKALECLRNSDAGPSLKACFN
ncbi:sigma-70 family RNA polymerase sigma factor [Mucilaginibacter sp. McL0603]|uniref:sigma-70 family RNA polymerase sigma factor n=1 Tax=Mucilaginibacter sp. McL0603 TaxID=3415670 RepID=UPI003CF123CA